MPGAIDAWAAILNAHGTFGLDRALAPAIRYAEHGFPVASRIAWDWAGAVGKLAADAGATRHYLRDGRAPADGDVVKLPALAQTLATIAMKGPRAFYEGPIADDMVATVAGRGSFLAAEDFASHRGEVVAPIRTNYRGLDVLELPPNTQGLAALVLLNILERFDLAALDARRRPHHLALRPRGSPALARQPKLQPVHAPVPALLDKHFGRARGRIDHARRVPLPSKPAPPAHRVSVVDRDRQRFLSTAVLDLAWASASRPGSRCQSAPASCSSAHPTAPEQRPCTPSSRARIS